MWVNSGQQKNSVAVAKINPECPNGCNDNGDGCYCYDWYKHYKEHNWEEQK